MLPGSGADQMIQMMRDVTRFGIPPENASCQDPSAPPPRYGDGGNNTMQASASGEPLHGLGGYDVFSGSGGYFYGGEGNGDYTIDRILLSDATVLEYQHVLDRLLPNWECSGSPLIVCVIVED